MFVEWSTWDSGGADYHNVHLALCQELMQSVGEGESVMGS
jgi:hypothetical protein